MARRTPLFASKGRLKRRPPSKLPRFRIVVCCEGKNTEPAYIKGVAELYRNALVSIEVHGAIGVPKTVVEFACEKVREQARIARRSKDSFSELYEVWCVFDVDTHPNLAAAMQQAWDNGVNVALSNPCFELWAVFHYRQYDAPCGALEIQRELARLMASYDHRNRKLLDLADLMNRIECAHTNSNAALERRKQEGNELGNPSSTVHRLIDAIRKFRSS